MQRCYLKFIFLVDWHYLNSYYVSETLEPLTSPHMLIITYLICGSMYLHFISGNFLIIKELKDGKCPLLTQVFPFNSISE